MVWSVIELRDSSITFRGNFSAILLIASIIISNAPLGSSRSSSAINKVTPGVVILGIVFKSKVPGFTKLAILNNTGPDPSSLIWRWKIFIAPYRNPTSTDTAKRSSPLSVSPLLAIKCITKTS